MAKLNNTPITANITFNEDELKFLRAIVQNSFSEDESKEEQLIRKELFDVFSEAIGINRLFYRGHTKNEIEQLEEEFNVPKSRNISSLHPIIQ